MNMGTQLTLTRMSGPLDGEVLQVPAGAALSQGVTFGRQPPSTILLSDDPEVSRLHARLSLRDGGWWLEDLRSANGTFVGEFAHSVRISAAVRLPYGQIFRVGRTRFRLEAADTQKAAAGASLASFGK